MTEEEIGQCNRERAAAGNNLDTLLDGQDVMMKLHISPRTLQTLRSNGTIPYTRIGRKIYYFRHDIGVDAGLFMMKLMNLKKRYGWSLLIIAHTPKRSLTSPITQNDLAGSKKLYNFFDSVFAIGKSAKDNRLRYVKQLKVRAGEYRYDSDNVIVYEIEKTDGYVHFAFKEFASEYSHLKEQSEQENNTMESNVKELLEQGRSYREIAAALGISKSLVGKIVSKSKTPTTAPDRNGTDTVDGVDRQLPACTPQLFD